MKKRLIALFIGISISLTGCSLLSSESEATEAPIEDIDAALVDERQEMKKLEENCYYIRHANGTYEKLYFGEASFDKGNAVTSTNPNRVMWFKLDFDEIPTYHQGDALIYYTKEELKEEFVLERFKDLGYSIGIRGLKETVSGRYSISTDVKDKCTYPMGDTDDILLLKNKDVIVDYIAGAYIRNKENVANPLVSEYGTIQNLVEGSVYEVKVYAGTEENDFNFLCDVRILGSMEAEKDTDYEFANGDYIVIHIPEYYHSGYYLINGQGMFRYVTNDNFSTTADARDMFNIPNDPEGEEGTIEEAEDASIPIAKDSEQTGSLTNENGQKVSTFNILEVNDDILKVYIKFNNRNQVEADTSDLPDAILVDPNGEEYNFFSYNEGLFIEVENPVEGKYTIKYKHLNNFIPTFTVSGGTLEKRK